jgi:hypothetical protein
MSEQLNILRAEALQQAIHTVIHDVRIPAKLRTALAIYQEQWADPHNGETDLVGVVLPEPTSQSKTFRPSPAEVFESHCLGRSTSEDGGLNCFRASIEQKIEIRMWHNDESLDWSVELNGRRHDHVTSEVLEALVECALIVGQASLTKTLALRPQ